MNLTQSDSRENENNIIEHTKKSSNSKNVHIQGTMPNGACAFCLFYNREINKMTQTHDLPIPLCALEAVICQGHFKSLVEQTGPCPPNTYK